MPRKILTYHWSKVGMIGCPEQTGKFVDYGWYERFVKEEKKVLKLEIELNELKLKLLELENE